MEQIDLWDKLPKTDPTRQQESAREHRAERVRKAVDGIDMYALTLWQPWCYAMAHLGKRVENRPWHPPSWLIGQRFALHAGSTLHADSFESLRHLLPPGLDQRTLPLKAVCATVRLRSVVRDAAELPGDQRQWFVGPFGWVVDDLLVLPHPVPCRGFQKLWQLPGEVLAAVRAQEDELRGQG
jgi:hypothetical protein